MSNKESKMTKAEIEQKYRPDSVWRGRSLENYKAMQAKVAESKGRLEQLKAAKTLTEARRICYGA